MELICFTVNGRERQYAGIPIAEHICVPINEGEIKKMMADQSGHLLETKSWRAVTDLFHDVKLYDIDAHAKYLKPVNFDITPEAQVTVHLAGSDDKDPCGLDTWAGTRGKGFRIEGFQMNILSSDLTLEYMAYVQGIGDTAWESGFVGTTRGQNKRIEGFANSH